MEEESNLEPTENSDFFTLGRWTVKPRLNQIISEDKTHSIEPKMMDVLVYLCQNSTKAVSAEQLLIACWAGTFYGDAPVQKCIAGLRKKLGCNSRQPIYIETIHRRGYKIIAEVNFDSPIKKTSTPKSVKQWTKGSPYLGLNTFEAMHNTVYFGRTKAIAEVIQQLTHSLNQPCHFLLLLGKSGSGKSSLIRAGVLPTLNSDSGFSGLRVKQHHILTPHQSLHETPIATLIYALNSLGLITTNISLPAFILTIEKQPELLKSALGDPIESQTETVSTEVESPSTNIEAKPQHYQLLVIDQFEQFLLDDNLSAEMKANLVFCIVLLAQCRRLLCIAMLRNDFYSQCLDVQGFIELKNSGIQYDLQAASPLEISEMIRNPAIAAGLTFECDQTCGAKLDDILLAAAVKNPDALPSLEYTLDLLYQQRSKDGILLMSAYRSLGGIEGAIAAQAEKVFNCLPANVQACWDKIMHTLVRIDHEDKHSVTSRKVPISLFVEQHEKVFIQHFLSAQLFVSILQTSTGEQRGYFSNVRTHSEWIDRDEVQYITIAHEALLVNWQRVSRWVKENSAAIQQREQLADDCLYWLENNKANDALLNSKQKVHDDEALLLDKIISLNDNEIEFILKSKRYQNRKKMIVSFVFMAMLGFSLLTWIQSKQVIHERDVAVVQSQRTQAISTFLTDMFFAQSPYLSKGKEMLVSDVLAKASNALNQRYGNKLLEHPYVDALLHKTLGTIYIDLGKIKAAEKHLLRAVSLHKNNALEAKRDYIGILFNVSRLYKLKGDYASNLPIILETIEMSKEVFGEDHKDTLGAIDNLATFYMEKGDLIQAESVFQQVYAKRKELFGENFRHTLYSLENLGRLYHKSGEFITSERYLQSCLNKWLAQSSINNPYPLKCMRLLAVTQQSLEKFTEAETIFIKHIKAASTVFGVEHPEVLSSKNSLAEIYYVTDRIEQSILLLTETLKMRNLVLGHRHIDTLHTQINLARSLRLTHQYNEALKLAKNATEISTNEFGQNHPTSISAAQELALLIQMNH
ncbi:MAG: tetratricopeptide repeat protein [Thalassotalea sp.]